MLNRVKILSLLYFYLGFFFLKKIQIQFLIMILWICKNFNIFLHLFLLSSSSQSSQDWSWVSPDLDKVWIPGLPVSHLRCPRTPQVSFPEVYCSKVLWEMWHGKLVCPPSEVSATFPLVRKGEQGEKKSLAPFFFFPVFFPPLITVPFGSPKESCE